MKVGRGVEFRQGVLEDIPFKEPAKFDFLYLSHVLEHTPSPQKAAEEINRVADRGYIETPSPFREQLTCPIPFAGEDDFHLHFVWKSVALKNTIAFVRKNERTIGEFTPSPEGRLAKRIFDIGRAMGAAMDHDLMPLIPRSAKTTTLYFGPRLRVIEYPSFKDAYAAGDDAYASARDIERVIHSPLFLLLKRFRRLRTVVQMGNPPNR